MKKPSKKIFIKFFRHKKILHKSDKKNVMSVSVTQYVRQKSIINNYTTEPNQPCDNGDWAYGTRRDCGPGCVRLECSELDFNTCNQNNQSIGENVIAEWKINESTGRSESPLVACTYDPSTFMIGDINLYIEKFGEDEQFNEVVMPQFCFLETTNCVDDPQTDIPWKRCPNMLATGESGRLCRNWRSNNVEEADRAQSRYCARHGSNPTCSCYTREDDPVYNIINPRIGINAGCWYYSCAHPEGYLVASNLINSNPPCPDDICPEINNIIATTRSSLPQSVFQDSLTCDITSSPKPIVMPSTFGGFGWWFFIIFFVIFIVIILIFVFYLTSRQKRVVVMK